MHILRTSIPASAPQIVPGSDWGGGAKRLPDQRPSSCHVELAPGCIFPVPESGLTIDRDFLIKRLPSGCIEIERARACIKLGSRLDVVSNDARGHCSIRWQNGWTLYAHHSVLVGEVLYDSGAALALRSTNALKLGRNGWPIIVRLNATALPL
jgi:hypothetical protein